MGLSRNKHNRNFPDQTEAQVGRLVTLTLDLGPPFQREGGRAITGDFPGDPMALSRKKNIRNFPDQTKAQDSRLVTLTLDLGLRHFKRKAVELLIEVSVAISWD